MKMDRITTNDSTLTNYRVHTDLVSYMDDKTVRTSRFYRVQRDPVTLLQIQSEPYYDTRHTHVMDIYDISTGI